MKKIRKAIDCELVEPSKTSPGYFKYKVTIEEIDGTIHKVPAYGVDMTDALSRVVLQEKLDKVYDSKLIKVLFIMVWSVLIVLSGILSAHYNNPLYIMGTIVLGVLTNLYFNYIDKKAYKR